MKKAITFITVTFFLIKTGVIAQSCLTEGITFTRQSEIDNFQNNYPNCSEIIGDVTIEEVFAMTINNLHGLSNVEAIGGDLTISNNFDLVNFVGLDNLESIGGHLKIVGNGTTQNLVGLGSLNQVGGDIKIYSNDIINLNGFGDVDVINGNLEIIQNYYLISMNGLGGIDSILGNLIVTDNLALEDISELGSLNYIGGCLTIKQNYVLPNLTGLENIDTIQGDLVIHENYNLTNLQGLHNVSAIDGSIDIFNCFELQDLTGLSNMKTINGDLSIFLCGSLTSLNGLDSLDASTIENLALTNNTNLSECGIESICNYLSNPNGTVTIECNYYGCNSESEVEETCTVDFLEKQVKTLQIFPNPARNEINLINGYLGQHLLIYTLTGQKIVEKRIENIKVDISKVPEGIYIVQIKLDKGYHRCLVMINR